MEALDRIQQDLTVLASFSRPMFECLLNVLLECIEHKSDSLRFRSACCIKCVAETGSCITDASRILGAARGRFHADTREPCEELRTVLIETINAILNQPETSEAPRSSGFNEDVAFCIQQGLLDEYSPVKIAASQCLEVFIKNLGSNLPDSLIKSLSETLQVCCKSKLWRVRHAAIKCMQECHLHYPDLIWDALSPVIEKLACDQSHQVRLGILPLCFIDRTEPRIQSLNSAVILCFDASPEIVSSALSALHIISSPSILSDDQIRANAIADSAFLPSHSQLLLHKVLGDFRTPSLCNTSKILSLRLVPVLVILFRDDHLALQDLVEIMRQEPQNPSIRLACCCAPVAPILTVINRLLIDNPKATIHDLVLLLQTIVETHEWSDDETNLLLVDSLEIVLSSDHMNSTIAETVISMTALVFSNRDRIDSLLIRLMPFCPNHKSVISISRESFNRELDRLVQTRTPLTPSDRRVLLQLITTGVDVMIPSQIYSSIGEYLKSANLITRMDGLELLYFVCVKFGTDHEQMSRHVLDGIELNLKWTPGQARNKVRKISLFVLHELMSRKSEWCITPNLVRLLSSCVNDSWSPDNRFLSLKIFALAVQKSRGYEGMAGDIVEHVVERFEDEHEEIRSLAFVIFEKINLTSLDRELVLRISDIMRVHAQVSVTARTILENL